MTMSTAQQEYEFLRLGIQYYVAARAAWLSHFVPVCGTLYHHAIEMLLKARLLQKYSLAALSKRPFGHKLGALWAAFKAEFPAEDLRRFDAAIAALDRFEDLRYPDTLVRRGVGSTTMRVDWSPDPPSAAAAPGDTTSSNYAIVVTDIDHLVDAVFKICSRNPEFFTSSMNEHARAALTRDNPVAAQLVTSR